MCLVNLVLTVVPLFYLSFFKVSMVVYNRIINIQRSFLWTWDREKRVISWVSWENVCKPMEEGGLGIKDIRRFGWG